MYHVIGTGITAILLYLISYYFSRVGYYSIWFHKKLWNTILAVTFLSTALAGVFIALQITYKWEIPAIKSILKWHVEFGIGMAFTGLFHFLWHINYFGKTFSPVSNQPEDKDAWKNTSPDIKTNLFIIGLISSAIQILLIREIMNIAGGYELITGTFLGSWLIGSSFGAKLAKKSPLMDIKQINLIFSISPVISFLLLFILAKLYLTAGETPSFLVSMIYTFLVLIPFTFTSGFTFVKLINFGNSSKDIIPGKSFAIETAGGIISGILISFLASGILNTYQILLLTIIFSVAYTLLIFYISSYTGKLITKFVITGMVSSILIFNPDIFFRQILIPVIKITETKDTPYGNVTIGEYEGEQSIYYNQRLLAYNDDVIEREENIHYAMLQSEKPEKVILISGSLKTHLAEILKYQVRKIIYIERDPVLAKSELPQTKNLPADIYIANMDAYKYIRHSAEPADVIILLIPPPSTLLLNRYYTTEFFNEVRRTLNEDGIFMCSPGPGETYLNKESLNMYSSIYNSLSNVFKYVRPVVGNKLYFIASDNKISVSFCKLSEIKSIQNIYVSSDFLSDDLITRKSDEVNSLFDPKMKQNRSVWPVAAFHSQSYNLSKNRDDNIPAVILMIILFALPVFTVKRRNMTMYVSASALAGFEIIVLLTLQLIIGSMYQLTGLVIAALMTGLAVGAGRDIKFLNSQSHLIKGLMLCAFYIGTGMLYNIILTLKSGITATGVVLLMAFFPALLTGHFFRELTMNRAVSDLPSDIYSADLTGSAFGFIIISGFALPVFGIQVSIIMLSFLIFAGFMIGTIRNKY